MKWYIDKGPESDVILSSRVRLARNIDGFPYTNRMNVEESRAASKKIMEALERISNRLGKKFVIVDMSQLGPEDKMALVERHLISEELTDPSLSRFVYISEDESISIMINEEDHIRIQAMEPGLNIQAAYKIATQFAIELEKVLPIGFHEKYGFTTACPTNTGTGMRASVMMHLPAMAMTNKIPAMVERIRKLGHSVRGYHGEHSKALGNLFQLSNQITLGLGEEELIADLEKLIGQISAQERQTAAELFEAKPEAIEDKVYRSLGILKYAKVLTSEEAMSLLSDVRLGKALGILDNPDETYFNRLMSSIGPANIQKNAGKIMSPVQRDKARALLVKEELEGI